MIGQDLRYLIPAALDHVYLNAALIGPTPTSVMSAAIAAEFEWQEVGPGHFPFYEGARVEAQRFQNRLQLLHPGGTVHLSHTHRDALMTVLYGLDLTVGDHIVTTDQEDTILLGGLVEISRRFGLKVLVLKAREGNLSAQLDRVLSPSTRLVAVSHVSPESGWALPVRVLADRLKRWPRARLLVDGSYAWGNIDINIEAEGADFYVLCGHKWLMAPPPAAALWVRKGRLDELLTIVAEEDRETRLRQLEVPTRDALGDRASVAATQAWPRLVGWALCLDYFEEEGFSQHVSYQFNLATALREAVRGMALVEVMDPSDDALMTSLVVLRSRRLRTQTLAERLWSQNIFVHPLSGDRGVRASWASFNTLDDVERLAKSLLAVHAGA